MLRPGCEANGLTTDYVMHGYCVPPPLTHTHLVISKNWCRDGDGTVSIPAPAAGGTRCSSSAPPAPSLSTRTSPSREMHAKHGRRSSPRELLLPLSPTGARPMPPPPPPAATRLEASTTKLVTWNAAPWGQDQRPRRSRDLEFHQDRPPLFFFFSGGG